MIKASWFGEAEISNEGMRNLVGNQLFDDFRAAMENVRDLYGTGDDLRNIISDMAPRGGVDADELARLARVQSLIHTIKESPSSSGTCAVVSRQACVRYGTSTPMPSAKSWKSS